jgi:hypothetical protein
MAQGNRFHAGTALNNKALWGEYPDQDTRCYYDSMERGKLVAVATSQDGFDNFTNYFCLDWVWHQQSDTSWVSEDELLRLAGKPVVSVA